MKAYIATDKNYDSGISLVVFAETAVRILKAHHGIDTEAKGSLYAMNGNGLNHSQSGLWKTVILTN